MENKKVIVTSMCSGRVGIHLDNPPFKCIWERRGAKKPVPYEVLEQAMYSPGTERMLRAGVLMIDDMAVKIALGLEKEGTKTPTQVITLTDAQMKRYLTVAPISELKDLVKRISVDQCREMIHYGVKNKIDAYEQSKVLEERTGLSLTKMLATRRAEEEEV